MATIFFKISNVQEKEVQTFMKEEGYASKAEFFRFLVKFYKYHKTPEQKEFEKAADELKKVLARTSTNPQFTKSLEEQLDDV